MLKRGFRGERKRILTPTLSKGEGECSDGKSKETSPLPPPKEECGAGKEKK